MNEAGLLPSGEGRRRLARWADDLARGDGRTSALCFVLLTAFYLATAAGNLSETDDVYAFAYRAEHLELTHLSDPRLMLFHIFMRLLFLGASGLGLDVSALTLMRGVSALCAAGSLLLVVRIAFDDLKLSATAAVLAAAVLAAFYGFWRYAAEAEVYVPAIFLVLLVFHGLSSVGRRDGSGRAGRQMLSATGWGALAGLAVLFYQPNVVPLFLAFPLLLMRRDRIVHLAGYLVAGGVVVSAGYLVGLLVYWIGPPGPAAFIAFLSQRTDEFMVPPLSLRTVVVSVIRATFALGHDIASANWIFAFDAVAELIHRAFSNNVITEEVYLAKRAGLLVYLAIVTFLLSLAAALWVLVRAWPPSWRMLRQRQTLAILAWIGINGAVIGRLNPAGVEAWIVLLPPLALVFAACVVEPCLRSGGARWIAGLACLLFLHNAVGGMALVHQPEGEYDRVKGAWVIAEAQPHDLVVVAGNAGLAETLRYLSAAEVALIDVRDVPDVAESLLRGDMTRLLTLTRGRDFNNRLLRGAIRKVAESGGRLVVFDDFFEPPERLADGAWAAFANARALRAEAALVYSPPGAGETYTLPVPAR